MIKFNLWTEVGLHESAKGKVFGFVYTNSEYPRIGEIPTFYFI